MSEDISSQILGPKGPDVKPFLVVIPDTEWLGIEDCASRGFEKACTSDIVYEPAQCVSLTNEKNASSLESYDQRVTVLTFDPSKSAEKIFVCCVCNEYFNSKDLLHTHMKDHEKEVEARGSFHVESNLSNTNSGGGSNYSDAYVVSTDNEERKYGCSLCGKTFKTNYDAEVHIRIHTGEKPYDCPICGKMFGSCSQIAKHVKRCDGKQSVSNDSSGLDNYVVHTDDAERKYGCSLCEKTFRTRYDLNIHIRTHTGEKPYECPDCGKKFASSSEIAKHVRIHKWKKSYSASDCSGIDDYVVLTDDAERKYGCSLCEKTFKTRKGANVHIAVHTGEKPYDCSICGKKFSSIAQIAIHAKTHKDNEGSFTSGDHVVPFLTENEERKYGCSFCEKTFKSRYDLKVHIRTHTGEKPYDCPDCGKKFASSSEIAKHVKIHNLKKSYSKSDCSADDYVVLTDDAERKYGCSFCDKTFKTRQGVNVHIAVHTGEKPYDCSCGEKFSTIAQVAVHAKTHNSNEASSTSDDSNINKYVVLTNDPDRRYGCSICDKTFPSRSAVYNHVRDHTGEEPYDECDISEKRIISNSKLSRQMKTMHTGLESSQTCQTGNESKGSDCVESEKNKRGRTRFDVGLYRHTSKANNLSLNTKANNQQEENMKIHSGENPLECTVCGKRFKAKSNLKLHVRMHIIREKHKRNRNYSLRQMTTHKASNRKDRNGKCEVTRCVSETSDLKMSKNIASVIRENATVNNSEPQQRTEENTSGVLDNDITLSSGAEELNDVHSYSDQDCSDVSSIGESSCDETTSRQESLSDKTGASDKGDIEIIEINPDENTKNTIKQNIYKERLNGPCERLDNVHFRTRTREKPYKFSKCEKQLRKRTHLETEKIHKGERPYQCSFCSKSFYSNAKLQHHVETHERLDGDKSLSQHRKIHSESKSYECSICSKSFNRNDSLNIHMRVHTGEKPYECSECGYRCASNSNLLKHHRTHPGILFDRKNCKRIIDTGEKSNHDKSVKKTYECSICSKSFNRKDGLGIHMRLHKGERPYQCSMCSKSFTRKDGLVVHMRLHTGERPYQCSECGEGFTCNSNLLKHRRTHTSKDSIEPYQCSVCSKSFKSKDGLNRHMRRHTGEMTFQCLVCGKGFTSNSNLLKHHRTHPDQAGIEPYECSICSKSFNRKDGLDVHMRIHTGEKPYECSECGKRFGSNTNLHKHRRTHSPSSLKKHMETQEMLSDETHEIVIEKLRQCSECGESFDHNDAIGFYKHMLQIHEFDREKLAELTVQSVLSC